MFSERNQNCQLLLFLVNLLHFLELISIFYSDFEINLQTIKTKNKQGKLKPKKKSEINFFIIFLSNFNT